MMLVVAEQALYPELLAVHRERESLPLLMKMPSEWRHCVREMQPSRNSFWTEPVTTTTSHHYHVTLSIKKSCARAGPGRAGPVGLTTKTKPANRKNKIKNITFRQRIEQWQTNYYYITFRQQVSIWTNLNNIYFNTTFWVLWLFVIYKQHWFL